METGELKEALSSSRKILLRKTAKGSKDPQTVSFYMRSEEKCTFGFVFQADSTTSQTPAPSTSVGAAVARGPVVAQQGLLSHFNVTNFTNERVVA